MMVFLTAALRKYSVSKMAQRALGNSEHFFCNLITFLYYLLIYSEIL